MTFINPCLPEYDGVDVKMQQLQLIIFDMAGTTVDDVVEGTPLVLKSYDDAFRRHGIVVPMEVLNEQRGRDKKTVITEFGGAKADAIYEVFLDALLTNVARVREIAGASAVFSYLHDAGVFVAVGSGFPADVSQAIIAHLGWEQHGLIDYWTCSEVVGISRPDPAMIHAIMTHLNVRDPRRVMKVDDTASGIEEGVRAGVATIGVLTGTQSRERLQAAHPTDILESVNALPIYLQSKNYL
jgi:phosphonatase-like hydrolase